ncbi:cholesterol esterase, partial [Quaeritorhiza haematococci]
PEPHHNESGAGVEVVTELLEERKSEEECVNKERAGSGVGVSVLGGEIKKKESEEVDVVNEAEIVEKITACGGTEELLEYWNYPCEPHTATTLDGYHLGLFRIPNERYGATAYSALLPYEKPPILLWHGFAGSSDVFLCHVSTKLNLALVLADAGFDVWLANSRGNKYSSEHETLQPTDPKFWDFGLDELAKYDVPAVVDNILTRTGRDKLSFVGYSQGASIMLAALALDEDLNERVELGFALAPMMRPAPLLHKSITTLIKTVSTKPEHLYKILGETNFFGLIQYIPRYSPSWVSSTLMDVVLRGVLGIDCSGFGGSRRKRALYGHMLSTTSVKNVVNWLKIISDGFRMSPNNDTAEHTKPAILHTPPPPPQPTPSQSSGSGGLTGLVKRFIPSFLKSSPPASNSKVDSNASSTTPPPGRIFSGSLASSVPAPLFPTRHITAKLVVFCGSEDSEGDRMYLRGRLPGSAVVEDVEGFGHLDFIWSTKAPQKVWSKMLARLHIIREEDMDRRTDEFNRQFLWWMYRPTFSSPSSRQEEQIEKEDSASSTTITTTSSSNNKVKFLDLVEPDPEKTDAYFKAVESKEEEPRVPKPVVENRHRPYPVHIQKRGRLWDDEEDEEDEWSDEEDDDEEEEDERSDYGYGGYSYSSGGSYYGGRKVSQSSSSSNSRPVYYTSSLTPRKHGALRGSGGRMWGPTR